MTHRVKLRSLAKINLDLRVLHKREDGYHELRTVFQTISLADAIAIEYTPAKRTSLAIDDDHQIPNNLVLQAAQVALDAMKTHAQIRFRLRKQIPMGAGLGGGSSNAAAVLLALPVLAGRVIPFDKLNALATALGSDVPFFLDGGTALGLGRGTELYPLADVQQNAILLVAPGVHVSTVQAYQGLNLRAKPAAGKLTSPALSPKINDFRLFVRTLQDVRSARAASALSANDFESSVFSQHPRLKKIFGKLRQVSAAHGGTARMTGSGSAMFAVFDSRQERDEAAAQARKSFGNKRVYGQCDLIETQLVSRASYRKLWRRQLAPHLLADDSIWPPRSQYAR